MYGPAVPAAAPGLADWAAVASALPSAEMVDPAHVRWHYKSEPDKRWTPFDGFDSLNLEQHYRHLLPPVPAASGAVYTAGAVCSPAEAAGEGETTDVSQLLGQPPPYANPAHAQMYGMPASHVPAAGVGHLGYSSPSHVHLQQASGVDNGGAPMARSRVLVRGGMYEVTLPTRLGRSLYWLHEQFSVTRGTWFHEGSWEPLDEPVAERVDKEYRELGRSGAWTQADPRAPRQAIHHVEFEKFVVVWYSNGDVAMHSGRALSKVMRGLYQKLGFEGAGEPLRRWYPVPAVREDRLPDITHLIFVVHGIGQKMDSTSIIKNTSVMRSIGLPLRDKHFDPSAGRAEFIPVEWRSSLMLDAGMIDLVTPHQMLGLRQRINESFMDIMYYTSPLYREEVISGLRRVLNTVYGNFSRHYPQFEARGGRVSVVAHSLGCVILHDLVTGWRPSDGVMSSAAAQLRGHGAPFHEIDKLRGFIETEVIHKMHLSHSSSLCFKVCDRQIENLFCIGSPLSVFLTMRSPVTGPAVVPANLCRRFFNIFYPHDPVAYRMEPLVSRYYANLAPVQVHSHTAANKARYCDIPAEPLARPEAESAPSQPPTSNGKPSWSLWTLMKGEKMTSRSASCPNSPIHRATSIELDQRLDYVLRETGLGASCLQALTSHSSYWNNADLIYFVLHHVLTPETPRQPSHL